MNEVVTEKRAAVDVMDALDTKLGDINALLDIMTTCEADQCDVNSAAYAVQRMVEDAKVLSNELYHS